MSKEIFDYILRFYNLPKNVEFISTGKEFMNESWICLNQENPEYILKKYNSSRKLEDIKIEHRILKHIPKSSSLIAPVPIGGIFSYDSRNFSMFRYIEGKHPQATKKVIYKLGEELAQMHILLSNNDLINIGKNLDKLASTNIPLAGDVYEKLKATLSNDSLINRNEFLLIAQKIDSIIHKLHNTLSYQQLIHGDFGIRNVLRSQNNLFAIIDWDEMRVDSPLFDIANFYYFYPDSFPEFISGYKEKLKHNDFKGKNYVLKGLNQLDGIVKIINYLELLNALDLKREKLYIEDTLLSLSGLVTSSLYRPH